jgi:UPF0755 protein
VLIGVGVVAVLIAGVVVVARLLEPMPIVTAEDRAQGFVVVTVLEGATDDDVSNALLRARAIDDGPEFLDLLAAAGGVQTLRTGAFRVAAGSTPEDALTALRDGPRVRVEVLVDAGARVPTLAEELAVATGLPLRDWQAALEDPGAHGIPDSALTVEGYLIAGEYRVDPAPGAAAVLTGMVAESRTRLRELGVPDDDVHRVLTLASLVQAELVVEEEAPKIARVVLNRLDAGVPLLLDATAVYNPYELSAPPLSEARRLTSPYNTFLVTTLPPGPIASPGPTALEAALHPADGSWTYYAVGDPEAGVTLFTSDVDLYLLIADDLRAWCSIGGAPQLASWRCG